MIGFPISRSFTTYCVCLELRSLPSTGITRLQRYYEPLRHPKAPGLSLAGFQLVVTPTTPWGLPCCVRFPCVHAVATTPAQRLGGWFRGSPAVSAFPERVVGSACALSFSRLARRSLTLRPAHAHGHQVATAIQRLQTFRHLHACSGCFRLERMPGGTCTHWKTPPCTAHGTRNHRYRHSLMVAI